MGSRSWIFTLNNYTGAEQDIIKSLDVSYLRYGEEVGENGTPHLQGMVVWKKPMRLAACKKVIERAHFEPMLSFNDSLRYVSKEGKTFTIDNRKQGSRSDLETINDKIIKGTTRQIIATENMKEYIKYHAGIDKCLALFAKPRAEKPYVMWIWGGTGVGKTRHVFEAEKSLWISSGTLQWWDGYENQDAVLFDDFRGDFITFHGLLRVLDRYPIKVPVKGGFREFNSSKIYITSCLPPDSVYKTIEDVGQLLRRIDQVRHMEKNT